jgi:hypothetical protein
MVACFSFSCMGRLVCARHHAALLPTMDDDQRGKSGGEAGHQPEAFNNLSRLGARSVWMGSTTLVPRLVAQRCHMLKQPLRQASQCQRSIQARPRVLHAHWRGWRCDPRCLRRGPPHRDSKIPRPSPFPHALAEHAVYVISDVSGKAKPHRRCRSSSVGAWISAWSCHRGGT